MKLLTYLRGLAVATALTCAASANAALTFVGSWQLGDGPNWGSPTLPAYSAQEAAALLFGGNASDYVISTVSNLVSDINNQAWYDQYGVGTSIQAQNTDNGNFYTPGVFSAYVHDNSCFNRYGDPNAACEDNLRNFAFRDDGQRVPEPGSLALIGLGLAGLAARRRQTKA